ncbi:EXS-domain-containing protein, partial [Phlegmacium glaucopus]
MLATDSDELKHHLAFPLPYRILFLTGLGILGWAINLQSLDAFGLDPVAAMDLRVIPYHSPRSKAMALSASVYRISLAYFTISFLSWALYRLATGGDASLVDSYGYIPSITAVIILLILVCPYNIILKSEREKFTYAIRRCIFPPPNGPIHFSDVILADIGTSFAKVLGDVWLAAWMLKPGNSMLVPPVDDGWLRWILPTVMSFPFFLRLRQCLIEYSLSENDCQRPLFNALKYATSFPVIFLSAAQKLVVVDLIRGKGGKAASTSWHGEHPLFRLWQVIIAEFSLLVCSHLIERRLLAAIVNSLYSFWWDVTNDWGLELMKFDTSNKQQPSIPKQSPRLHSSHSVHNGSPTDSTALERPRNPAELSLPLKCRRRQSCYGLRSVLLYPRAVYPAMIFLNLLLRMTWSIRLSTHVHATWEGSLVFFWLEVAELVRRWLWVFVRVEWEVIKTAQDMVPTNQLEDPCEDEVDFEIV